RRMAALRVRIGLHGLCEVGGPRERSADPDVVEWRLIDLQAPGAPDEPRVLHGLQAGLALLDHSKVDLPNDLLVLRAEVRLSGEERREGGRRILINEHLYAVGVRQTGKEVVGVPDERDLDIRLPALEHPRPGADHRLDLLEVAELLYALLRDD